MKNYSKDLLLILFFVIVGVATRTFLHIGPNIEFITGLSIFAGYFFRKKIFSLLVPVLILFFSDLIIGNSNIYLFTWSGFIVSPLLGIVLSKSKLLTSNVKKVFAFECSGIISSLVFFLWTNFGVVVLSTMYTKDFNGLLLSYFNGLPFLANQLLGNLVIIPIIYSTYLLANQISRLDFLRKYFLSSSDLPVLRKFTVEGIRRSKKSPVS